MKIIRFCLVIIFDCIMQFVNAQIQELNLKMEDVDAYARPAQWYLGHPPDRRIVYHMIADSTIKHGGKYSLKLFSTSDIAYFGSCFLQIPLPENAKVVVLKGFVKTEHVDNGFAGLFMALVNDSTTFYYDNMQNRGLKGTMDWGELLISLPCIKGTTTINFGGLLAGKGRAWFDDFTLIVDDKIILKSNILDKGIRKDLQKM